MDGYTITLSELIWHFKYIIILCNEMLSTIMPKFAFQGNAFRAQWETLKLALFYFFPSLGPYFTSCHIFLLTLRHVFLVFDLW